MSAHRLEAVLVGHVRQGDRLSVVARVAEAALRLHRLVLRPGVLHVALLLGFDTVTGFVIPLVRPVRIGTVLALADDRYRLVGRRCRGAGYQRDQGYLTMVEQKNINCAGDE